MNKNGELIARPTTARDIKLIAYKRNRTSKSNGSMMRCTPLAVYLSGLVGNGDNIE